MNIRRFISLISKNLFFDLLVIFLLVSGCERLNLENKLIVRTDVPANITYKSCHASGMIIDMSSKKIIQHGFCWSESENPSIFDDTVQLGVIEEHGSFSRIIESLEPNTSYFIRAYATTTDQTVYGRAQDFTTDPPGAPVLLTDSVVFLTDSTALSGGRILDDGGSFIIGKGICWNTSTVPTLLGPHSSEGQDTASFESEITGLRCGTNYYVRAYAFTSTDTGYGEVLPFETMPCLDSLPEVFTAPITDKTGNSAVSGGSILNDRGFAIIEKGVCWSTNAEPTIEDHRIPNGSGSESFVSHILGLEYSTTYYVRAYAINTFGPGYGEERNFTTDPHPLAISTMPVVDIHAFSATGGGENLYDGGEEIIAKGLCWSSLQNPEITDYVTNEGSGTASFSSQMTGLDCNTDYYVRAYVQSSQSVAYGLEKEFTTDGCPPETPSVITLPPDERDVYSATVGGALMDDGGAIVLEMGIYFDTSPGVDDTGNQRISGSTSGSFTMPLDALSPYTTYYYRAYARNSAGIGFGDEFTFKTLWDGATVQDYNGNSYQTIQIGEQVWMQENLKATYYANGDPLQYIEIGWDTLGVSDRAYCWNDGNGDTYGALYTWAAATNDTSSNLIPSGVQGVCPNGWHIPSDEEWKQLEAFLGMSLSDLDKISWRGTDQGTQLKTGGASEFEALLGGFRYSSGSAFTPGNYGAFWSSTEYELSTHSAYYRMLDISSLVSRNHDYTKQYGLSVRCIHD
jgi:uncharacterized protein (TIGR02145 family)